MKPDPGRATLWVFDFDGTISEFASSPDEAEIHPACRDLLRDLAALPLHRVAILSSRRLDDVIARVDIPGLFLGGGSGMEWRRPTGERFLADPNQAARLRTSRQAILPNLRILEQIPGIELEDKQWSACRSCAAGAAREQESGGEVSVQASRPPDPSVFQGPRGI